MAMPMNYFHDSQPAQAAWFDRWVAFQRDHVYGRQMVPGVGVYMNSPAESLGQLRRATALGSDGSRVAGVALYSYAVSQRAPAPDEPTVDMWDALAQPGPLNGGAPPFAAPAEVPPMAWKSAPSTGALLLRAPELDGATIEVSGPAVFTGVADGNGVYGLATLPPGRYTVSARHPALAEPRTGRLEVAAGMVVELELR